MLSPVYQSVINKYNLCNIQMDLPWVLRTQGYFSKLTKKLQSGSVRYTYNEQAVKCPGQVQVISKLPAESASMHCFSCSTRPGQYSTTTIPYLSLSTGHNSGPQSNVLCHVSWVFAGLSGVCDCNKSKRGWNLIAWRKVPISRFPTRIRQHFQ